MLSALWLGAGAAAGACATAPTDPGIAEADITAGRAEWRVTLAIGQSVTPDGAGAEVTLVDVTDDSRCPSDATCVWAGDAAVAIQVRPASGPAERIVLHSGTEPRAGTVAGLHLTLERLDPLPMAGQAVARDAYRAAILISR